MKRNKQTEKLKELRRAAKKSQNLTNEFYKQNREFNMYSRIPMVWEPVEVPQFLGWELKVTLGEAGLRRRDAEDLIMIMKLFGMYGYTTFTRYPQIPKLVKSAGYNYVKALEMYKKNYSRKWNWYHDWNYISQHYFPYFGHKHISQQRFDELPDRLKPFFVAHKVSATMWTDEYWEYRLNSRFPHYELRIKATRAYSTHRGIPVGELISEEQHLDQFVEDNHYYCEKNGTGHNFRWSKESKAMTHKTMRKRWTNYKAAVDCENGVEIQEAYEAKSKKYY